MKFNSTFKARFWAKVRKTSKCWVWTAATCSRGYGRIKPGGAAQPVRAHRASWWLHFGKPAKDVLHRCDNPLCVRPDHLFLGTQADNMADMIAKGRDRKGDMRGIKNAAAKLKAQDIRSIRKMARLGQTHKAISDRFGVTQANVSLIIRRKTWPHVR